MKRRNKLTLALALAAGTSLGMSPVWAQTAPNPGDTRGGPADRTTPGADRMGKDAGTSGQRGLSGRDSNMDHQRGSMHGDMGHSKDITKVQEALKQQGFDPGPVDGKMGPKTSEALRSFQLAKNLQATGQLDAKTAQELGVEQDAAGTTESPRSKGSSNPRDPSGALGGGMDKSGDSSQGTGDGKSGTSTR